MSVMVVIIPAISKLKLSYKVMLIGCLCSANSPWLPNFHNRCYTSAMYKAALALLVGLMLSVSGSAWGAGTIIWEGTKKNKTINLLGLSAKFEDIQITTEGIFINGKFFKAYHLSEFDRCLYGLTNFPENHGYIPSNRAWKMALSNVNFRQCQSHRRQGVRDYYFEKLTHMGQQENEFAISESTRVISDLPDCPSDVSVYKHNCYGSFIFEDGARYDGEWRENKYHGQGTYLFANGDKYTGEFKQDKSDGHGTFYYADGDKYVGEYRGDLRHGRGIYTFGPKSQFAGDKYVGEYKDGQYHGYGTYFWADGAKDVGEFKNDKLNGFAISYFADGTIDKKGFWEDDEFQPAQKRKKSSATGEVTIAAGPAVSSAEVDAERQKRLQVEAELAALKAQQQQQLRTISSDTQVPLITITQHGTDQRKGTIRGFARDNVQVAEVLVDGVAVNVGRDGSFEWSGFVPATGKDITIEAIDTAALSSSKVIRLERGQIQQAGILRFDDLDPMGGKKVKRNDNALALIVGISKYDRTQAPAIFADKDAQYFHDYASLKMGIPETNITTMVNADAEQVDVLLAVKNWLSRAVKQNQSDVYVFFAGHGLASDDGEQMYLLPYDGAPELLDDTAIARERLFTDIASANPRSVTVFLDTCYSGTTRGTDMLIASRPIAIKALKQSVPDNFTVMTAAAGDQTAKPLEEAKHGMFSYFLMKGMEGEADANQDNKITAGELHSYVQTNVIQQSSGSQTPELQGDADRVLVQFH